MPELPEVETTRLAMRHYVQSRRIEQVIVRDGRLRYPVAQDLPAVLRGECIDDVQRRGKYLVFSCRSGDLLVHLGMSGSLRVAPRGTAPSKHDHVDIELDGGHCIRYRDPRRFGLVLWTPRAADHALLRDLGPEPLEGDFNAGYLADRARGRKTSIKSFVMDSRIVVGVGNIYANEALFLAGIRPTCAAGRITKIRHQHLVRAIKDVLRDAVTAGGTTLRDFASGTGQPGYFQQKLHVYGRAGQPCLICKAEIKSQRLGQRSTYYCPLCQR